MMNNLIHEVLSTQLCRVNEHVSHINWGGCGYSALALYDALISNDIQCDIVFVKGHYGDSDVRKLLRDTNTTNVSDAYMSMFEHLPHDSYPHSVTIHCHVAVRVDNVLYDSDGVLYKLALTDHIRVEALEASLTNTTCWNGTFKRANQDNSGFINKLSEFYHNMLREHLYV